jgi:hypothetical protein
VVRVTNIADPGHKGLLAQPARNLGRVLRVALATHGKGFEAYE